MAIPSTLRVVSFDHTSRVGGVTTWNLRAVETFARRPDLGIDFRMFGNGDAADVEALTRDLPDTARARVLKIPRGREKAIVAARRMIRQLEDTGWYPDVILPQNTAEGWLCGELYSQQHGSKRPCVIGTLHSDEERYYQMCGKQGPVDATFAVSRHCLHRFEELFPGIHPVEFVPSGVPIAAVPRTVHPDGPIRLVYCGRLVQEQKRSMDLVALCDELLRARVDFRFDIVGDGPCRAELVSELAKRAPNYAHYAGRLDPSEVLAFLAQRDVFVQVSAYEGTSISMLEAMGQGLVPCMTDVASGARDVITPGENGWLVPIGDMRALADAIGQLANNRALLARAGQSAYRAIQNGYTTDRSAEVLAGFIRRVVGNPRGPFIVHPDHPQLNRLDRSWLPNFVVRGVRTLRSRIAPGTMSG